MRTTIHTALMFACVFVATGCQPLAKNRSWFPMGKGGCSDGSCGDDACADGSCEAVPFGPTAKNSVRGKASAEPEASTPQEYFAKLNQKTQ